MKLVIYATSLALVAVLAGCAAEAPPSGQVPDVDVDTVKPEAKNIGEGPGAKSCSSGCSDTQNACIRGCRFDIPCVVDCSEAAQVCVADCPIE